jgi:hypothetical protein
MSSRNTNERQMRETLDPPQAVEPSKILRNGKTTTDSNERTLRDEYKILSRIHRLGERREKFVKGVPVPFAFFELGKAHLRSLPRMQNRKKEHK